MNVTTAGSRRLSPSEALALWKEYKRTGGSAARDKLILTFSPMVKYIVYRKIREVPAHFDVEDFISCGLEGLIGAIDRYDPAKGASLEQFAWTRIHGALLDELRRQDWAPRSLRRFEREANRARDRFAGAHGRQPTRDELGDELGVTVETLRAHEHDLANSDVGSLNVVVLSDDETHVERIDTLSSYDTDHDPEHQAELTDAKERFRQAFERLPERERKVAVLLYVNNMTLRNIAELLGVCESRVCQIHSELRRRLRTMLRDDESLFTTLV